MREKGLIGWIVCLTVLFSAGPCFGQLYRYKDAAGNWHFTDSPDRVPQNVERMKVAGQGDTGTRDLRKQLYEKFSPRNRIEEATLGTVTVKTAIGIGSGFFISDDGYILTNKHVIRLDEQKKEDANLHYERLDKMAEEISKRLAAEEGRMEGMQERLDKVKKLAETERNPSVRTLLEDKYRADRETLEQMQEEFNVRKKEFLEKKEQYEREKAELYWKTSKADRSINFRIILKDNSEFDADLIAIGQNMDLALLKLYGYKTPYLRPGNGYVPQGQTVYAIGSPAGLKDSVSSGVISGADGYFLKTDAKIYPGNSGGPLVDQNGRVLGINTLKAITHKFEGLGFAIRMSAAMQEFKDVAEIHFRE